MGSKTLKKQSIKQQEPTMTNAEMETRHLEQKSKIFPYQETTSQKIINKILMPPQHSKMKCESSQPSWLGPLGAKRILKEFQKPYLPYTISDISSEFKKVNMSNSTKTTVVCLDDDIRQWGVRLRHLESIPKTTVYLLLFFPPNFPQEAPYLRVLSPTGVFVHHIRLSPFLRFL